MSERPDVVAFGIRRAAPEWRRYDFLCPGLFCGCPEHARIFREKAETDPISRERQVNEAIKGLEQAVGSSSSLS